MITLCVSFALLLPIFFMFYWMGIPTIMPMPKASINKHGNFLLRKHKIWSPLYWIISPPSNDVISLKYLYQTKFSRLISIRFYSPHDIRSFSFCKNIRHKQSPCFKFNTKTRIRLLFRNDTVVSTDYIRHGRITFCFVK